MSDQPELTRQELSDLVDVMLNVGEAMLEAGAASFRTEETMAQVGLGLGAERVELYITPTGIIATAVSGQEQRTRVGRVRSLGVNMARTVALNRLSRDLGLIGGTLGGVRQQIAAIQAQPRELPAWTTVPAVAIACAAFTQILGGDWADMLAALVGAGLAQWLRLRLHNAGVNIVALTVLCALAGSVGAWGVCQGVTCARPDLAAVGSVLLLVPGVPLVNSIIDLTNNDLVSGVSRGTLAAILALSIGVGVMLALWITGLEIVQ